MPAQAPTSSETSQKQESDCMMNYKDGQRTPQPQDVAAAPFCWSSDMENALKRLQPKDRTNHTGTPSLSQ